VVASIASVLLDLHGNHALCCFTYSDLVVILWSHLCGLLKHDTVNVYLLPSVGAIL